MRILLLMVGLTLAGCTNTVPAFDPCADARDAYAGYRAYVEDGGKVSAEDRRKVNAAKRTADRLCAQPQIDIASIIIAAAQIAAAFNR